MNVSLLLLGIAAVMCLESKGGIELQSYNFPDFYVRTAHRLHGGAVTLERQVQPEIWEMVTPGLCNLQGTVSFRISVRNTNTYLRHRHFVVYAEDNDGSTLFANDACFYLRQDKWFPGHAAFESVNVPNRFIRHQYFRLKLHSYSSTTLFEMDASFRILEPNCKQFRSQNFPGRYFALSGNAAYLATPPELWVPVRPGLSGHKGSVSFRSCYDATKYLYHRNFEFYSGGFENSRQFKLDATFTERERFFQGTTAYESVNFPSRFIRHHHFRLRLDPYSAASTYRNDASFYETDA